MRAEIITPFDYVEEFIYYQGDFCGEACDYYIIRQKAYEIAKQAGGVRFLQETFIDGIKPAFDSLREFFEDIPKGDLERRLKVALNELGNAFAAYRCSPPPGGGVTSTRNHGKIAAGHCLPDVLGTDDARKYFAQLAALGLMETNERGALIWKGTKKELALTAELMSEKLRISQKWKVFERVFNVCNLAQARYRAVEIDGRYGDNEDDIKAIFK